MYVQSPIHPPPEDWPTLTGRKTQCQRAKLILTLINGPYNESEVYELSNISTTVWFDLQRFSDVERFAIYQLAPGQFKKCVKGFSMLTSWIMFINNPLLLILFVLLTSELLFLCV